MAWLRSLLLVAGLVTSLAEGVELKVAVFVQETAQIASLPGDPIPSSTHGADLVAFTNDLAREICQRIHARCSISYVPFAEILPSVEEGRFDLGFGNFLHSPTREKRVLFSAPIFRSSSRLIGSPATARRFAAWLGHPVSLDNLRDAHVAAMEGSQQQTYLEAIADERNLKVVATSTTAGAVDALREKRADFALLPIRTGYALISRDRGRHFGFIGPAVADRGLGDTVHVILPKNKDALRRSLNRAIAEIRADGTAHRIMRQHFPLNMD